MVSRIEECTISILKGKEYFLGGRTLPLFTPSGAFRRLLTPHRLAGKGCRSGAGRFLKVLEGVSLAPIRRTTSNVR